MKPSLLIAIFASCLVFPSAVFAHGMSAADQYMALYAGPLEFIELGARHMLSGYDHLLFLFGVVFYLSKFKQLVQLVTAFTLGHSITLMLATLLKIQANYYLIDAVIALTIIYKAFENLQGFEKYLRRPAPNLILMVFVFGLIHGFGLSTRLQMLPLPETGLVLKILSFNLGVELAQVLALSLMLLLLTGWRKHTSFQRFSTLSNGTLLLLGFVLMFSQLHAYVTQPRLATDDHHELHLPK